MQPVAVGVNAPFAMALSDLNTIARRYLDRFVPRVALVADELDVAAVGKVLKSRMTYLV